MHKLTNDEVKQHCFTAKSKFLVNCNDDIMKAKLDTLEYDIYYNKLLTTLGRSHKKNQTLSMRAGGAKGYLAKHALEYSPVLHLCTESERFNIISHELAHLLDFELRDMSLHDSNWKNIHVLMGGDGEACPYVSNYPRTSHRPYRIFNKINGILVFGSRIQAETLQYVESIEVSLNPIEMVK